MWMMKVVAAWLAALAQGNRRPQACGSDETESLTTSRSFDSLAARSGGFFCCSVGGLYACSVNSLKLILPARNALASI